MHIGVGVGHSPADTGDRRGTHAQVTDFQVNILIETV
jgi:hypothetical protein